ncbi:MAG: Mur ligase family protein, partial [Nitriliruptoraceae bacterium]
MSRGDAPGTPPGAVPLGVRRALVIGAGRSGLAAARLLVDAGAEVTLVEEAADAVVAAEAGIEVVLGRPARELLDERVELVVPSPGVSEHAPALRTARARGIAIWSEPELALRRYPRRLLGVTGTNGKTSVTELLTAMARTGGVPALACGNIGTPVSEVAAASAVDDVLVAELSSFQLRFTERLRAEVAVLTNLAPDHLDWHGDLAHYQAAKARLFTTQTAADWAVLPADDPVAAAVRAGQGAARLAHFRPDGPVPLGVGWQPDGALGTLVWRGDGAAQEVVPVAALAEDGGPV